MHPNEIVVASVTTMHTAACVRSGPDLPCTCRQVVAMDQDLTVQAMVADEAGGTRYMDALTAQYERQAPALFPGVPVL
jgi:hypothetical protein